MRSPIVLAIVLAASVATSQPKTAKPTAGEMLRGKAPGSVELLRLAPFGTPMSELGKRFPNYDAGVPMMALRQGSVIPEDEDGPTVTGYWINGLTHDAWPALVKELTAAWGEPIPSEASFGPVKIWLDATAHVSLRAQIVRTTDKKDHSNWFLHQYTPLTTIVGKKPGELACTSKQKLLGATRAQLEKAYGKAFNGRRLDCGEHEWADKLELRIDLENDVVVGYRMMVTHGGSLRIVGEYSEILRLLLGSVPDPAIKEVTVKLSGATAELSQDKVSWTLRVSAVSAKSP